jgi:peptide/nickel transport system permease protein
MHSSVQFWLAFKRNRGAVVGLLLLLAVLLLGLFAPLLTPYDPMDLVGIPFTWPFTDASTPFGTDNLGRDLASGILYGARVSVLVGLFATAIALVIGTTAGAVAGYYGGRVDDTTLRIMEIFQTIPNFIFVLMIVGILGADIVVIAVALGIVAWPLVARLARVQVAKLAHEDFVLAARGFGMSDARIIATQILPNAMPPVIVMSSVIFANAILVEAALSFLGMGDPSYASWGGIIGAGRAALRTAWYISAIPGVAIVLVVLAVNLVGEGLNDAINPRLRQR